MSSPIQSEVFEVVSGGASNPRVIAGTADPSAGGGVAAAEGTLYLRFVAGGGEQWIKRAAANTAWVQTGTNVGDIVAFVEQTNPVAQSTMNMSTLIDGTAFNGDTLGIVMLYWDIISAADATTTILTVRENGNAPVAGTTRSELFTGNLNIDALALAYPNGVARHTQGSCVFNLRRTEAGIARLRKGRSIATLVNNAFTLVRAQDIAIGYNDSATNITSLLWATTTAAHVLVAGFSQGSKAWCARVGTN